MMFIFSATNVHCICNQARKKNWQVNIWKESGEFVIIPRQEVCFPGNSKKTNDKL